MKILLGSYNGEKFISEQLESLLNQTYKDFTIIVSDDCSKDSTWSILKKYKKDYPDKIEIEKKNKNSGNAKYNFLNLMLKYKDDYILFCDQDDVWLPNKVEVSLAKIKELEKKYGKHTPCLVHSDLFVVDENLKILNSSFRNMMNADYTKTKLNHQIIQNTLTGCTCIYNQALSKLIFAVPPYLVMHDWWIMLIASAFGKTNFISEPTIYYRQHGNNEIGAKNVRSLGYKIAKLFQYQEIKLAISNTYKQAESLLIIFEEKLSKGQKEFLREYCNIPNLNKIQRWQKMVKLNVMKNGISRKIAHFIFI